MFWIEKVWLEQEGKDSMEHTKEGNQRQPPSSWAFWLG